MIKKSIHVIPKGHYCYSSSRSPQDPKYKPCPYWSIRKDKPSQLNGYCDFLKRGDWEGKSTGLLWDQCKECGINDDWEDYQ